MGWFTDNSPMEKKRAINGVRSNLPFYHMHTFTFFLPGIGKTQRNISEAHIPFFFFSFQVGIFLKSRLEIWHGHNFVQKLSFLLPYKHIMLSLIPFSHPAPLFFFALKQMWTEKPVTSKYHLLSAPVLGATVTTIAIAMLPQHWGIWSTRQWHPPVWQGGRVKEKAVIFSLQRDKWRKTHFNGQESTQK